MDLFFIRHGQSSNNDLFTRTGGRLGRKADPDLTDLGKLQADKLAEYLAAHPQEFGFTHIYSSLMTRAIQTAAPTARLLGLPVIGQIDLHESGGVYLEDDASGAMVGQPGKTRAELAGLFPNLILPDNLDGSGWWNKPFEGSDDRPQRSTRVAQFFKEKHGGTADRVAIVSHYGFFNHLVWSILGLERPQGSWFVMNNSAIARFEINQDGVNTIYLNRVPHLTPDLISE